MDFLFFFLTFTTLTATDACFMNCYCDDFSAECILNSCADDLETDYDLIKIRGKLRETHKYVLTHIVDNSEIVLKDDVCGTIPNCW